MVASFEAFVIEQSAAILTLAQLAQTRTSALNEVFITYAIYSTQGEYKFEIVSPHRILVETTFGACLDAAAVLVVATPVVAVNVTRTI